MQEPQPFQPLELQMDSESPDLGFIRNRLNHSQTVFRNKNGSLSPLCTEATCDHTSFEACTDCKLL